MDHALLNLKIRNVRMNILTDQPINLHPGTALHKEMILEDAPVPPARLRVETNTPIVHRSALDHGLAAD